MVESRKSDLSVSVNDPDEWQEDFEELAIGEPADWRLNEIMRNLNVAFVALVVMMGVFIAISVFYYFRIWGDQNFANDAQHFKWIQGLSLGAQFFLCLLFLYYYYKMKAFYSQPEKAKPEPNQLQINPSVAHFSEASTHRLSVLPEVKDDANKLILSSRTIEESSYYDEEERAYQQQPSVIGHRVSIMQYRQTKMDNDNGTQSSILIEDIDSLD